MKKISCLICGLCIAVISFTSCEKPIDEPTPTPVGTKNVTIDASDFADWKYFSFETGKEVPANEVGDYEASKTKTNWDIAFHRGDIRTNSGLSGSGKGGAIKANGTKIDDVKTIPTSGYAVDEEAEIMIEMGADGYRTQSKNVVLAEWYKSEGMPPVYVVNDYVFVVKTADGKYAVIKFTDYTNDAGAGGYVSFAYKYPVE